MASGDFRDFRDFRSAAELFERANEDPTAPNDEAALAWIQAGNWIRAAELYLRQSPKNPKQAAWCLEAAPGVDFGFQRPLWSRHSIRQASKGIQRAAQVEVRHELGEDLPAEPALNRLQDGRPHRLDGWSDVPAKMCQT